MAQPLQRRRHQEPAKLPWLATRPRSLGPTTRPAKLDRRRYRKRTIPTDNAIRAILFAGLFRRDRRQPIRGGMRLEWLYFLMTVARARCHHPLRRGRASSGAAGADDPASSSAASACAGGEDSTVGSAPAALGARA